MRNLMVLLGRAGGASAADTPLAVDEAGFSLHLAGDWAQRPTGDPERWTFESRAKRTRVEISVIKAHIPGHKRVQRAQAMAAIRRHAEQHLRADRRVRFGEQWAELTHHGQAGHAAFAARDDRAILRFMAWATAKKLVSVTVETTTGDNACSEKVFDEVMAGFEFSAP